MTEHTNPGTPSATHIKSVAGRNIKQFRFREEIIRALVNGEILGFYITAPLRVGDARVIVAEFEPTGKETKQERVVGWDYLRKMDLGPIANESIDLNAVSLDVIDHFEAHYGMRNHENQAMNFWYHGYW